MEIVNGYICRDCTDAALAQRNIDPAKPQDGPFGVNAEPKPRDDGPAVVFGGALAELNAREAVAPLERGAALQTADARPGARLDISV